jgi:demethylmenaquinone methyltransferase/2-methoxy-6-polyprenyl-1,4-benzoquinol methylase
MLERAGRYSDTPDPGLPAAEERGLAGVIEALSAFEPRGAVLELACGTGWWTGRLAQTAVTVTALDAAPEMLRLNEVRVPVPHVRRIQANVFDWQPDRRYDTVFFGFWLSHVPPGRFDEFWDLVDRSLSPHGRVFFIDEMDTAATRGVEVAVGDAHGTTIRTVEDGRSFQMVKVWYEPASLEKRLTALGWDIAVRDAGPRFLYGFGGRQRL